MRRDDVYPAKKLKPIKSAKSRYLVEDKTVDIEYISASARLIDAVEILQK